MGDARKLWIPGPQGRLEAALRHAPPGRGAAVVAHPHPLHGGTLHNPVVFHVDRELNRAGFTTLRFNFRGVGDSSGEYDQGHGEVEDLAAAVSWIRGLPNDRPLLIVGYSFGGVCSIRYALRDRRVAGVLAIGLPVRLAQHPTLDGMPDPLAVVQAENDEFGTPDEVRSRLTELGSRAEVHEVVGTGHLFRGRARDAAAAVVRAAGSLV